jgi:hypothetical protein
MMIQEFGRNFILLSMIARHGTRSPITFRNILKDEPDFRYPSECLPAFRVRADVKSRFERRLRRDTNAATTKVLIGICVIRVIRGLKNERNDRSERAPEPVDAFAHAKRAGELPVQFAWRHGFFP